MSREAFGGAVMGVLWNNVSYGVRVLVRNPGFAAMAIVVLGLGVGVNLLVFSVVDAILLRPLPYPKANGLVWMSQGVSPTNREYVLAPDFVAWRMQTHSFEGMAAFSQQNRNLQSRGEPERILTAQVSADFFKVLGIQPVLGRDFRAEEDRPGGRRVAIVTHGLWLRRVGEDAPAVEQTIKLDDELVEVIGVLPKGFHFPEPLDVEIVTPLALGADQASREAGMQNGMMSINVIARLKPGVTLNQAQSEMDSVQQGIVEAYPRFQDGKRVLLQPLQEHLVSNVRRATLVLLGAVAFLSLLSCLNIGSVLLAKTISRRSELAVRTALGASRRRVLMQLFIENALITLLACVFGVFFALLGRSVLILMIPKAVFGIENINVHVRILGFMVISFVVITLLISLISVRAFAFHNVVEPLKSGAIGVIGSARARRVLSSIVVGELAIAVVLLVCAGLLVRSFWVLRYGSMSYSTERVLTLKIDLTPSRYPDHHRQSSFFESLLERLSSLAGVESVALCSSAPPTPVTSSFLVSVEPPVSSPATPQMAKAQGVSSEYFRALHIPILDGEMFSDSVGEGTPMVAVVNRAFIQKYFEDGNGLGRRIRLGGSRAPWLNVIGVVEDFKNAGLAGDPEPEVYRPYRQFPFLGSLNVVIKTSMENPLTIVPAVRQETWALDPEQPLAEVQTLDERLTASVAHPRFTMSLLIGFALLALILAGAGVYGVMSYSSQQRRREIAIRLVLGAEPKHVIWMIVREGLMMSVLGVSIGLVSALAASRLLASLLYGITPSDPYAFMATLILLMLAAISGCYLPASRATRVEASDVLRYG